MCGEHPRVWDSFPPLVKRPPLSKRFLGDPCSIRHQRECKVFGGEVGKGPAIREIEVLYVAVGAVLSAGLGRRVPCHRESPSIMDTGPHGADVDCSQRSKTA